MVEQAITNMVELSDDELNLVSGGVAFAAGGTNSAAVTLATGNGSATATFFGGDGVSAINTVNGGGAFWDARAT